MMRSHAWLWLAATAVLVGCGGGGPTIKHEMPMDKLWSAPPEERDGVAAAHKRMFEVHAELDHTRFLLDDTRRQVAIARAERKRARQEARIAELQKDRRAAAFRTALVQTATDAIASSHEQENTLKRKIHWLEVRESYLKREVARLEAAAHASEAKLELAKAQLAVKRGALAQQDLRAFEAQAQRADSRLASKQRAADEARKRAEAARNAWGGS